MEYNAEEETKSYNVHRKTGDYIIGEVLTNQTTSVFHEISLFGAIAHLTISLKKVFFAPPLNLTE